MCKTAMVFSNVGHCSYVIARRAAHNEFYCVVSVKYRTPVSDSDVYERRILLSESVQVIFGSHVDALLD
jgi:hypothetical protein